MAIDYTVGANQLRSIILELKDQPYRDGLTAQSNKAPVPRIYDTIRSKMNPRMFQRNELSILEDTSKRNAPVNLNIYDPFSGTMGTTRTRGDVTTGDIAVGTVTFDTLAGIQLDFSTSFMNTYDAQRTPEWSTSDVMAKASAEIKRNMWGIGQKITQQIELQCAEQIELAFQDITTTPLDGQYDYFSTLGTEGQKNVPLAEHTKFLQEAPIEWESSSMNWMDGESCVFATTGFKSTVKEYQQFGSDNSENISQWIDGLGQTIYSEKFVVDSGNKSTAYLCAPNAFGVWNKVFDGFKNHPLADESGTIELNQDFWLPMINLREIDPSFADVNVEMKGYMSRVDNSATLGAEAFNDIETSVTMFTQIGFHNSYTSRTGETGVWRYDLKSV